MRARNRAPGAGPTPRNLVPAIVSDARGFFVPGAAVTSVRAPKGAQ